MTTLAASVRKAEGAPRASIRERVSPEEWRLRLDLAAAHRYAQLAHWEEESTIFNHFTARVPGEPDWFLIKPHELTFSEVTASNLIKVHARGPMLGPDQNVNAPGFAIHSAIFNARPDVQASLHLHSFSGSAISVLRDRLQVWTQDGMRLYNRIVYHDYAGVANPDEAPSLVRDLGSAWNMILRNHGVIALGPDVVGAAINLGAMIREAELQLRLLATGAPLLQPPADMCEATAQIFERSFLAPAGPEGKPEWRAILRLVERADPSYKD